MKTVVLKRKADAPPYITDEVIIDDIINGLLSNNYYVPVLTIMEPRLIFCTVDILIKYYLWPIKDKVPLSGVENFLYGHNPNLFFTIEHYEDNAAKDHQ